MVNLSKRDIEWELMSKVHMLSIIKKQRLNFYLKILHLRGKLLEARDRSPVLYDGTATSMQNFAREGFNYTSILKIIEGRVNCAYHDINILVDMEYEEMSPTYNPRFLDCEYELQFDPRDEDKAKKVLAWWYTTFIEMSDDY